MRRFIIYLLAGASLPLFSRFQEAITYRDGHVIHEARTYGQTVGILIALCVAILLASAILFEGRLRRFRFSTLRSVFVSVFALPALWNNWTISEFGGADYSTHIKLGIGGPLAPTLFLATAAALVVAEIYRVLPPPDDRYPAHS